MVAVLYCERLNRMFPVVNPRVAARNLPRGVWKERVTSVSLQAPNNAALAVQSQPKQTVSKIMKRNSHLYFSLMVDLNGGSIFPQKVTFI